MNTIRIVCAGVYQLFIIVYRIVPVCEPYSVHSQRGHIEAILAIDAIKSSVAVWKKVKLLYIMIIGLLRILHMQVYMLKVRESGKRTMIMTFIIVTCTLHFCILHRCIC